VDLRNVDPATYGNLDGDPAYWEGLLTSDGKHPSWDYYKTTDGDPSNDVTTSVADQYVEDELYGCHVDHPYMRWLVETTRAEVEAKFPTMREALLAGFQPLGPVPNDFGYPDTYWHWINFLHSRPRLEDRNGGATPDNKRDNLVVPHDLQHLLMVPAYRKDQVTDAWGAVVEPVHNQQPHGEATDGWVVGGIMYATEVDPGAPPYPGCKTMHSHSDTDTDHMHMWLYHPISPLAMNPPHLCNADGSQKDAPYGALDPLRNTETDWYCYYPDSKEHPDDHDHEH
jgi:hypothetical protein